MLNRVSDCQCPCRPFALCKNRDSGNPGSDLPSMIRDGIEYTIVKGGNPASRSAMIPIKRVDHPSDYLVQDSYHAKIPRCGICGARF
jgi:hypothetical protein